MKNSLQPKICYSPEEWERFVQNGNFEPMKTALQKKTLTVQTWLLSIKFVILNYQLDQAECVFRLLLQYQDKNIYIKLFCNSTLLHLITFRLNSAIYQQERVSILCRMIENLLEIEAQERIQYPENKSLFLDQIAMDTGSKALDLLYGEDRLAKNLRQRLQRIIETVERKYPQIVQLKEEASAIASGEEYIGEMHSVHPTLSQRHAATLVIESSPLLTEQTSQQQTKNVHSFWWQQYLPQWIQSHFYADSTKQVVKCS